jgi:VWFA-related protein
VIDFALAYPDSKSSRLFPRIILGALIAAGIAWAQGPSIDTDLVHVNVVVTDRDGSPVSGLPKARFRVFDDGIEQKVTDFSPVDDPVTTVLLFPFTDHGFGPNPIVERAATGFIGVLRPDDDAILIAYDAFPRVRTDFTKNKEDILEAFRHLGLSMNPGTCLYDAVWYALERLDGFPGRKAIFLIATGRDTASGHGYPDLLKRSAAADAVIYPISVLETSARGSENITTAQARNVLTSLADSSGGTAFFFNSEKEFAGIFETVEAHLKNPYRLGFVPANRKTDGRFHKLRVEVSPMDLNHDGKPDRLNVRYRQGYYAPKS